MTTAAAARGEASVAVISGASSGIGAALAQAYAQRGWRVVLVGRRGSALDATAMACAQAQGLQAVDPSRLRLISVDLRDIQAWREHAVRLLRDWGCPQVVVAAAGISHGVDLSHAPDLQVAGEIMHSNWLAALGTLSPFIAPMRARGSGTLAAIASVAGVRGLPGHAAYSASKAALIRSLESLRVELRGSGVRVVTVSPGFIATPMTAGNPFPMPFLLDAQAFARRALRAIDRGSAYATIPWPMAVLSKLMHVLPRGLWDRVARLQGRKPRREPPEDDPS
ncbi:SDR family oxidoreductase [Thiomonas sp.]|uniref:SDR family oxidoreductase n=1 Tax=Thiomonas sp. TaxID=2047785 RepID=UPI002638806A|nr:SDR family oxidoreductase [Thiomonas sp.]